MIWVLFGACLWDAKPFPQTLDHSDPSNGGIFAQWITTDFEYSGTYNVEKTVFYLPGWKAMGTRDPFPSSVRAIAKQTGAALFALEHRFFGNSVPTDLTDENLAKYLTVEQILGDIAKVIISYEKIEKLMIVGGSYAGVAASWFKAKYPKLADGAWASSAPVHLEPFIEDGDANLIELLKEKSEECYQASDYLMKKLEAVFTHGDDEKKQEIRSLFGVPENVTDTAFLYIVAEVFLSMAQSEGSAAKLLSAYCYNQKTADMQWLAVMFNKTLTYYNMNVTRMDPYAPSEAYGPRDSDTAMRNMRAMWFLKCSTMGHFVVHSREHPFRSRLINQSFYDDVCMSLFGFKVARSRELDVAYGDLAEKGASTVFTFSTKDYMHRLMNVSSDKSNEVITRVITDGESYSSDLEVESADDSPMLKQVRNATIDTLSKWITMPSTCSGHGTRILNQCKCDSGWMGDDCDVKSLSLLSFKLTASMATVIPTVLVLCTTLVAWCTIINNEEATGIKRIVF